MHRSPGPRLIFPHYAIAPLAVTAVLLLSVSLAAAASTSFWSVDSFEAAERGRLDGTSVLHDGRIVLSGELEDLDAPQAQYVWAGAATGGGIVTATGTPGRVLMRRGDEWVVLLEMETVDFPAMAVSPEGDIFVGTAPEGNVYRVTPDGVSVLYFETGEDYVWSLAYSDEHGLIVGTGDTASVYAVEGGVGELLYQPDDLSISAVAAVDDRVLAGTSMEGLLIDVTPGRDLRVLYDSSFEDISGIVGDGDGNVFFTATSVSFEDVLDPNGGYGGFGEGALFRVNPAGGVAELWRSRGAPVTSLGLTSDGTPLVGVGTGGLVYAISQEGNAAIAVELAAEEVLSVGGAGDILTTGGPGRVYTLGDGFGRNGTYESEALDALAQSIWGSLTWDSSTPGGSDVKLFARSGNTHDPDETWSDWSAVEGEGSGPIECPEARYFQWKATLTRGSGSVTPTLLGVEAAYLRENLAPIIGSVVVHDPGDVVAGSAAGSDISSTSQTLPGGLEVSYSLDSSGPVSSRRDLPVLLRGIRTASWEALDPNGDALTFDVFFMADDEESWKLVEEGIQRRTLHTWDTQTMTDGTYRMKVTVSDRHSNPEDRALSASSISQPFDVDHTEPGVSDVRVEETAGGLVVTGDAEDSGSAIAFVDVSLDYGDWFPAFAEDGMFDSRTESFRVLIEDADAGEHVVAVRAVDRHGNPGVVRRVVR